MNGSSFPLELSSYKMLLYFYFRMVNMITFLLSLSLPLLPTFPPWAPTLIEVVFFYLIIFYNPLFQCFHTKFHMRYLPLAYGF